MDFSTSIPVSDLGQLEHNPFYTVDQETLNKHLALGQRAIETESFPAAEANFRYYIRFRPEDANANFGLALALSSQSKVVESMELCRQTVQLDPAMVGAQLLRASLAQRLGLFREAIAASHEVIKLKPELSKPYVDIVNSQKIIDPDDPIVCRMKQMVREPNRSSGEQIGLSFGLGKALNDLKQFDQAISFYDAANEVALQTVGKNLDYRPALEEQANEMLVSRFSSEFLELHQSLGNQSELPVFIVGMIRSGTTLLDTMLASHPDIASAGELVFWDQQAPRLLRDAYDGLKHPAAWQAVATQYRRDLRIVGLKRKHVIDKMPMNFQYLGLIHILFPNAKMIHLTRLPVDICLSIYMTDFGINPPRFAFSRSNIVHAYRQYETLMAHWRNVLPRSQFLEVDYADLVLNQEPTLHRVIEFLGLEWAEAVLHHESSTSDVATPSRWQARQPIYTSSLERWRNYETWLGEFRDLL